MFCTQTVIIVNMRVFDESEIRRLRMFENKMTGSVFGSKREEVGVYLGLRGRKWGCIWV